jgi:cobalt-zinc-cadmium efflux system outer membrane protein
MLSVVVAMALLQGPDSLTLTDALARARAVRPQLAVAAARVAEARAALRTAGTIPNPIATYSHSESTPREHFSVEQPLDWLIRRGADRAAARAGINRALADSSQSAIELMRAVRLAFFRARAALLSETLVQAQTAEADSLARIAAARYRAGDVSLLEQEQAAQEAARARQTASSAREAARVAASDLERELGAGSLPPAAGPLDAGLDQPPDSALVLDRVPALRVALADSAAAAALARSAARARIPFPAVQGGAEWADPTEPGTLATFGVTVPLPIWQHGQGPVAEAEARALAAAALTRETRLEAERQVREVRIRLEESARRARIARDSLIPAAAVLRARAFRAYQSGETGIVPVLDAFRAEREVALSALQDELAYQEAVADWDALTGAIE